MPPLTLPRQSNPGRDGADGNARLINCHAEDRGSEGKFAYSIYCDAGLKEFSTLSGGGATRAVPIVSGNNLYVPSGSQMFKVDQSGTSTSLGGIAGSGLVSMSLNQKSTPQIMVVAGGLKYIVESDAISPITDTDLPPPNDVVHLNQRFVATLPNGRFHWSALLDGTSWGANDFATAEHSADGLKGALTRKSELLLFGTQTIEPWYNPVSGSDTFAKSGSVIEVGCLDGNSLAKLDGEIPIFVASDKTVRILEGYATRIVSNHAVERAIRDETGTIEGWAFSRDGHPRYVISASSFTWVFDLRTLTWHEKKSYGLNRWRGRFGVPFAGKIIVGDYDTNKLYELDEDTFDEAGDALVMEVWVPLHAFPKKVRLDELRIDTIPGVGSLTNDPQLMVKLSRNGGETWGNERRIGLGKVGEWYRQVRLNMLGTSNEDGFVVSISASANVLKAVLGLDADYKILRH